MSSLGKALTAAVAVAVAAVVYQFLSSQTLQHRVGTSERRIDEVAGENRAQDETLKVHQQDIGAHSESIKVQAQSIEEVQKRLAAAEALLGELSRTADLDRAEMQKIQGVIAELKAQGSEWERRKRELEETNRELKKSLQRDSEFDRRLLQIEKQLGIERPQT